MDYAYAQKTTVSKRAPSTGFKIAVIGAGPAGLSCAGELARQGHTVTLFEKRPLAGGLSTYGIIVLREPVEIALAEVEMIRRLGVELKTGIDIGCDIGFEQLQTDYQAIFLSCGLGSTPSLGIPGDELCVDGLEYIEQSKIDRDKLRIGREVVVVGAGNTAIDCATIARRLGATRVTLVYRRTESEMTAYPHEYEFIKNEGVEFRFLTQPSRVLSERGMVTGLECVRTELRGVDLSGRPAPCAIAGSDFVITADQIVKAIGQNKPSLARSLGLETIDGFIKVDDNYETSVAGVFAGGDCIRAWGAASTVMAVEDGKLAASAIDRRLTTKRELAEVL